MLLPGAEVSCKTMERLWVQWDSVTLESSSSLRPELTPTVHQPFLQGKDPVSGSHVRCFHWDSGTPQGLHTEWNLEGWWRYRPSLPPHSASQSPRCRGELHGNLERLLSPCWDVRATRQTGLNSRELTLGNS